MEVGMLRYLEVPVKKTVSAGHETIVPSDFTALTEMVVFFFPASSSAFSRALDL
jgi:hypothetical protein